MKALACAVFALEVFPHPPVEGIAWLMMAGLSVWATFDVLAWLTKVVIHFAERSREARNR